MTFLSCKNWHLYQKLIIKICDHCEEDEYKWCVKDSSKRDIMKDYSNSCFSNRYPAATGRKVYINDEDVHLVALRYEEHDNIQTRERAFVLTENSIVWWYRHRNASLVTKRRYLSLFLSFSLNLSQRPQSLFLCTLLFFPYFSVYRHQAATSP